MKQSKPSRSNGADGILLHAAPIQAVGRIRRKSHGHTRVKQRLYILFSGIALLLLHGSIGSMELERISMRQGIMQCVALLVLWVFFIYRARLFCWQDEEE